MAIYGIETLDLFNGEYYNLVTGESITVAYYNYLVSTGQWIEPENGSIILPMIKVKYFLQNEPKVKHTIYRHVSSNLTNFRKALRAGMPPNNRLVHWVRFNFLNPTLPNPGTISTPVTDDVDLTLQYIYELFNVPDDFTYSRVDTELDYYIMTVEIVYRESVF